MGMGNQLFCVGFVNFFFCWEYMCLILGLGMSVWCVCVCTYGTMCAIACVWRTKDNFLGSVFKFYLALSQGLFDSLYSRIAGL